MVFESLGRCDERIPFECDCISEVRFRFWNGDDVLVWCADWASVKKDLVTACG